MSRLVGVLRNLRRNGDLARIELAFLFATMVEWACWLALVVIAFERGGPAEAGIVGFAVGIPAIVVAPTAAVLGDRWPRSRVLLGAYTGQAVAFVAAAVAFIADAGVLGYAFGVAAMAIIGLVRPLLASVLPEVARTPEELTAANVATGLAEGGGALGGPLVAGILFGLVGPEFVLVVGAATMVIAAMLMLPVAVRAHAIPLDAVLRRGAGPGAAARAIGHELTAGAAAVIADRRLAALTTLMAVTIGVLGALSILIVVVAIDVLGFDQDAAGYLTAVGGLGALLGSAMASALVGRDRLAKPLLASVGVFAVAVAIVGLVTAPGLVVIALVATGIGWSIATVAATTLTQRLAGDNVMTRVFGVNEAVQTGAEALGGLLVPVLVVTVGSTGALVACGVALLLVAGVTAPVLLRADRIDPGFLRDLGILRAVPMLAPLSGPVIERLAGSADHVQVERGTDIIREGESGDRFYVIATGRVHVSAGERDAGELGPGGAFGEIALLRDLPRTATVAAVESTELLALRRDPFLEALTGQPRSRAMATEVVQEHLRADER